MKVDFEAEFTVSGRPKSARVSACNDFKLARWKELDEETQEHWNETAKTKHATTKKPSTKFRAAGPSRSSSVSDMSFRLDPV